MTKRTKNILLFGGFVLILVICYPLAFRKTIEQKKRFNVLKQEVSLSENASKQFSLLRQKQIYYDSLLTQYQLDGSSFQNNLLKTINAFANQNKLKVVHFLEPHVVVQKDLTVKTYEFVVEGGYNAIVLLIHQLEQKTVFGEIVHLHFEKKKNFRTGSFYLQARVLLKSLG